MLIGDIIRNARESEGLVLEDLANVVGVSHAHLSMVETGRRNPSVELIESLAEVLPLNADQLKKQLSISKLENKHADIEKRLRKIKGSAFREKARQALQATSGSVHDVKWIPILGEVPGDPPEYADLTIVERAEDKIAIPEREAKGANLFALRMIGNRMAGKLDDGDLAVIDPEQQPESGEIALVLIGEEATIKQVEFSEDFIILRSMTDKVRPIVTSTRDDRVKLVGRVVMRLMRY